MQEKNISPDPTLHNIASERIVLGMLLNNIAHSYDIEPIINSDDFYIPQHREVFTYLKLCANANQSPNIDNIVSGLPSTQDNLKEYLTNLQEIALGCVNIIQHAQIIAGHAIQRDILNTGNKLIETIKDGTNPKDFAQNPTTYEQTIQNSVAKAETALYGLGVRRFARNTILSFSDAIQAGLHMIEQAYLSDRKLLGIDTGFDKLNKQISGFKSGDLVVIAARPSMGKSALGLNLAVNAAKALQKEEGSVGFFSLEMSVPQVITRIFAHTTGIGATKLTRGEMTQDNMVSLRSIAKAQSKSPLFFSDESMLNIAELRSKVRRLVRQHNMRIIFVDYLQLLHGVNPAGKQSRVTEIGEISQGLKAIAKEMNICVVALAQLSRAVEQRESKRPLLSDLRESGSIEQDADIVMFIYRYAYYLAMHVPPPESPSYVQWRQKMDKHQNIAEIIIAKHRNGATGALTLGFNPNLVTFYDD